LETIVLANVINKYVLQAEFASGGGVEHFGCVPDKDFPMGDDGCSALGS
jgi:hypothetical protein